MAELLPLAQADRIAASLIDYLGTTFALSDPDARRALDDFLSDAEHGMFRGPYVRLRLPFRPAADGWRDHLEWYEGFTPYGHQAAAFERLSSRRPDGKDVRPQPTLVTTGTGSGKTEAFSYPILDHVQRAKRRGVTGTKAIVLYPMNALANDQAGRLARLIASSPALAGVTAALYTGESGEKRTIVTADGLITDREVIRSVAPDILLTNYKMLDQLLLRSADAGLWKQSADSLQYLVLDEFHTYDGAQGTDVSMLLRRLGMTLRANRANAVVTTGSGPLGTVTPVATSATLGDGGDPTAMLDFAETVFGEAFGPDCVVTESRLSIDEWSRLGDVTAGHPPMTRASIDDSLVFALAEAAEGDGPADVTSRVCAALSGPGRSSADGATPLDIVRSHPLIARLVASTTNATALDELVDSGVFEPTALEGSTELRSPVDPVTRGPDGNDRRRRRLALGAVITALSHIRADGPNRDAVSVDVHLWVRELTRLDRAVAGAPSFVWSDDGVAVDPLDGESDAPPTLPAVYCRLCNRSGWGVVLAPTGADLDGDETTIRRRRAANDDRFRALIHAPAEGDLPLESVSAEAAADAPGDARVGWLVIAERRIVTQRPDDATIAEGGAVPVLVDLGADAGTNSVRDVCPSCGQRDGIRFLGSAIATMLSVSLSTMFGTPDLDSAEKRALVFTDSVQDAAHRAGFVQARSRSLTLRALIRQSIPGSGIDLESLSQSMITDAGDDKHARYRLLPPDLADRPEFSTFWSRPRLHQVGDSRARVAKRLLLDLSLEFGLRSTVGRTLSRTGTAVAEVAVPVAALRTVGRAATESAGIQLAFGDAASDEQVVRWVRGVLEHMRLRGAIAHVWFDKFRFEDGSRWRVTGGRPRSEGMPAFGRGNSAPGFPLIGTPSKSDSDLEPVASQRGWHAQWAAKNLGLTRAEGAVAARTVMERLARDGWIGESATESGNRTFALAPSAVVVFPLSDSAIATPSASLVCSLCGDVTVLGRTATEQLAHGPCFLDRCVGTMQPHAIADNFYRDMYRDNDVRRVVAREHTSLLDDETRLTYESEFKSRDPEPDAPNVLVATPTLEMGIDIGDLSAVMLSSLPRSVASYVQRVGRAGRLTGNAVALAFVTGRGDQLPRFSRPTTTINGAVRPPATYLDAEEILRRQFVASVADRSARRSDRVHPRSISEALAATGPDSYLGQLIADAETNGDAFVAEFLSGFSGLDAQVTERLEAFPRPVDGPGTSDLAKRCHRASAEWKHRVETLVHRSAAIQASLPELGAKARSSAATEDDKAADRTARVAVGLVAKQLASLRSQYWISALETFGLLPNYTLLDDSVTLAVAVHWIDPTSADWRQTDFELTRSSAQALRDFAPGSTFYAGGYAIDIDAVDLGIDNDAVRTWTCCPACGYVAEPAAGPTAPSSCPRCGTAALADTGQSLAVVELTNVSAVIRRDEAAIDDARDERQRTPFTIVTAADIDPTRFVTRWFVESLGFGVTHRRDMTIRWINTGGSRVGGSTRQLAGHDVEATMFRVCSECGKLDTDTRRNHPQEHRPWCSLRKAPTESTVSIALARSLTTEGLVLRLPASVTWGDAFAIPSLSSALLVGLRERIGGDPDHLQVVVVHDPTSSGTTVPSLLVHDVVPGGTGYLADLATPENIWDVLARAYRVVATCPCAGDGKLACDKCLLPFAAPAEVRYTSRSAAQRHLRTILTGQETPTDDGDLPTAMTWTVVDDEPVDDDPESALERRFRAEFTRRVEALGAHVTQAPSDRGIVLGIALGPTNRWTMRPQENILGSKPDFLLTSVNPGVPPTAIFTDGRRWHATPAHNRLADDAEKRRNLRDGGYQVVAVTHHDLLGTPVDSAALGREHVPSVLGFAGDGLAKSSLDLVFGTALDLLVAWVQAPTAVPRQSLAHFLPVLALPVLAASGARTGGARVELLALAALDGATTHVENSDTVVWRSSTVAVAVRVPSSGFHDCEIAVVLDDADEALGDNAADAWREWLLWSNLLQLRQRPAVLTTRRHLESASMSVAAPTPPAAPSTGVGDGAVSLPADWQSVFDEVTDAVKGVVVRLADAGLPAPVVGEEVDGLPVELSWPAVRVVCDVELTDSDRVSLQTAGWTVCAPDRESALAALDLDSFRNRGS
ncbi:MULTISPECIES: DEAD/DEAH box helicase [Nocardiaceae]|uniref:DEAD/DEAH box helicase n=1 Tax=Rhodococcoides kroppenstedtii TaxID=293050 RepID=A0ABS7NPQ0_9NOCA|nr:MULTISPECIES: DEAD/DEAH box helicase [Rhodococcus]AMY18052.1 DEAD-box ATP-dependent RNA helicase CshA [Rhodococcus sp. PBTS 1]MBY6313612.1 DEAD/DEAH box helicase [Rhodococcus kroppenstedtii]MBY6319965.1 DEAD/DEAH box helicase [Rhodococcus kroppenstedtii]MBY6398904.1 DEAD/DEAH box helicase [Rhodococcus kroppenstedtii]